MNRQKRAECGVRRAASLICLTIAALVAGSLTIQPALGAEQAGGKPANGHPQFDWSEWQRLPVQSDGRIKPLDSLADELVNLVTGRSKWTDPDAKNAVTYAAP